jgi:hypothetical protein
LAIFIAYQDFELQKARGQKRHSSSRIQLLVKQPTRKAPKDFEIELDSDFTTLKIDVKIHGKYYEQ